MSVPSRTLLLGACLLALFAGAGQAAPRNRIHIVGTIASKDIVGGFAAGADSIWAADVQRTELLRIEPATNRIVARIPIGKPLTVIDDQDQVDGWVTFANGFVWATDQAHDRIVRVDPGTNRVVASIRVPSPWDITVSDGAVWVPQFEPYSVARIDTTTNKVVKTIPAVGPTSVAAGAGSVWVVLHRADDVIRIDPTSNTVLATIPLPQATSPERAFFLYGSLWVSDGNATNAIFRINPATNRVVATIRPRRSFFGNFLTGDGRWLWDVTPVGHVYKIDPRTNRVVDSAYFAHGGRCGDGLTPCLFNGAIYADGTVWAYDQIERAIIRIRD